MRLLHRVHGALIALASAPIHLYRRYLSPLKGPCCRFSPTCSEYALIALREWGLILGVALSVWRILRCNPFGRGGEDPVPVPPWKRP